MKPATLPFPVASVDAFAEGAKDFSPSPHAAPTRILLLDSNEASWRLLRDLLRQVETSALFSTSRFLLDWVPNFERGLQVIARGAHEIYFLGSPSGERSALELLQHAVACGAKAPLIALVETQDAGAASLQAGAADFLPQTELSAALLSRALRYTLAQAHTKRQLRRGVARTARLRAAIDNADLGVALLDARAAGSPIAFVNPAFESLTGYSASEVIGRSPQFLQGPQTDADKLGAMQRSVEAGRSFRGVALTYRKDGTTFWNAMQLSPIGDENGQITNWAVFFSDVSERIEAQNALKQSHRDLAEAQRLTHLGSWASHFDSQNLKFHRLTWSDEVFRILGLEPRSVVPTPELFFSLVHPDDLARAMSLYDAMREGVPFEQRYRVRRPDGEERLVWVRAEMQQDERERRIIGTILDITQQQEAETLARQSEARLRAVMDAAPILIWATDTNGIFTLSQGRVLEVLGLKQDEAVGSSIFEMYGHQSAVAAMIRRALKGEASRATFEVDDNVFDVNYAPTRDEQGRISGAAGVSYDISERVQAQRQRDESEARFERIAANMPGMVYRFERALSGKMRFLSVSDGCRDIYGVEPEEILSNAHSLMEVVHPDELAAFFDSIFESEKNLTPWNWEGRVMHQNGETRWIRGQARPARQSDGSTVWDGLVMDVSAGHTAQDEILRSRTALNEAQMLARLGSFEWNLATGEVMWSDEMYRLLGRDAATFSPDYEAILPFISPLHLQAAQGSEPLDTQNAAPMMVGLTRADGVHRTLQTHSHLEADESGRVVRLAGWIQDVTETVEAQNALRESEQRYALAAQGANDGLWDWDLQKNRIYLSPRWKTMLGYAPEDIGDDPDESFSLTHEEDRERLQLTIETHLSGQSPHFECEFRLRAADGSYRWMLSRGLVVRDENGAARRIAGSQTDITERKAVEAQLSHNAFYDTLTHLPNRALFLDRLERTLSLASRDANYSFAVLFLDIDRFKNINDSLGHLAGDALLVEAAQRFASCLRPGDTVARLGGDEFALLIDDIGDSEIVNEVAGRIQRELERPFSLEGKEVFVTVSIGIAPSYGGEERPDELLRNADTAMYRAKAMGRARHEVFDATMHQRAVKTLELETDLWRAIERDELLLHYQPIVSLGDGQICGCEALVRWQHPQRGLVPPSDFIPLAEESGLIVPIGWWVLGEACRQALKWNARFPRANPYFMAVNLSSKQFSQADMIERVRDIVTQSGLDPRGLQLEITESVIMENSESAATMFLQLKELGIRFAMDDFGTGYSSLSYLHRFPLDVLKIDRSFVSQMRAGAKNEIVDTILSLANGLSMTVVAEGVETRAQYDDLRDMGCGCAQGFFFSKPLDAEQMEQLLGQNPVW